MKKVLFISHVYSTASVVGSERVRKFKKFLPKYHYQAIILTSKLQADLPEDAEQNVHRAYDPLNIYKRIFRESVSDSYPIAKGNLIKDKIEKKNRQGIKNILREWFIIPDRSIVWLPFALTLGLKLIRQQNIVIIFSTFGPGTNLLVGLLLSKLTGVPLVADFRDGWLFESIQPFLRYNRFRQSLDGWLERQVVVHSKAVITVSDPLTEYFRNKYGLSMNRALTITNGYDPDNWLNVKPVSRTHGKFRLVHTGAFNFSGFSRSLFPVLAGLSKLPSLIRSSLEVFLVGNLSISEQKAINDFFLSDVIKHIPMVSREYSLGYQNSADLLLLVVGDDRSIATSKLYEYLYARRPILVIGSSETAAAKIVSRTQSGIVVGLEDPERITGAIKCMFELWQNGNFDIFRHENIEIYDRLNLTKNLVDVFETVLNAK